MNRAPVVIYTDGSAHAGAGGVGVVVIGRRSLLRIARYVPPPGVTNQMTELMAAYLALGALKSPSRVRLISDSAYLINCFNDGWISNWRRKNWRKSGGGEVAHRALWETIEAQAVLHEVEWIHMRGHGRGEESRAMKKWNGVCDKLAHTARVEKRSWTVRTNR